MRAKDREFYQMSFLATRHDLPKLLPSMWMENKDISYLTEFLEFAVGTFAYKTHQNVEVFVSSEIASQYVLEVAYSFEGQEIDDWTIRK